jgi:hypothetical protein
MHSRNFSYLVDGLLSRTLTLAFQQEKLNICGQQGWELIAVRTEDIAGHEQVVFYFKRPISESEHQPRFDTRIFDFAT